MSRLRTPAVLALSAFALLAAGTAFSADPHPGGKDPLASSPLEWQVPDERAMIPFAEDQPVYFVNRTQARDEWDKLPAFWNAVTETATDPKTGRPVERKAVKIKVPLGLTRNPPVPQENPLTVAKFELGKRLYFDPVLSANGVMSCADCHKPEKGYTDQLRFSSGILGKPGGASAPTVINSGYHTLQFWDGRATSLEDQAQGPVQNALEMFDGEGDAWVNAVQRLRKRPDYVRQFRRVFGTEPTRDAVAKAVAAYERTVLSANSLADRAELALRKRVEEDEVVDTVVRAKDFEAALKDAAARNDGYSLQAIGLTPADAGKIPETAKRLADGRALFFGKARCNSCHAGDNYTDNEFHNLGVGVRDGRLTAGNLGRFAALPTGHKHFGLMGAFKTPTLRHLLGTAPYLHDGSEATLEQVVEFYHRGGNANEFLDVKMRDTDAERKYQEVLDRGGQLPLGVQAFGQSRKVVVPLSLHLTAPEKADLVLFLKALQGDPVDPVVADPKRTPPAGAVSHAR